MQSVSSVHLNPLRYTVSIMSHVLGSAASIFTALCWAIGPICFAGAGRRIGPSKVAIIRILAAILLLTITLAIYIPFNHIRHFNLNPAIIGFLTVSGIVGMGIGDLLGYRAYVKIGAQHTTQIFMLAPLFSAVLAWIFLGEHLAVSVMAGAGLVLAGTWYTISIASNNGSDQLGWLSDGILSAIGASICTGIGAVTSRQAFLHIHPPDPIIATWVRVGSAAVFLSLWGYLIPANRLKISDLSDRYIQLRVAIGSMAGPFLGMIGFMFSLSQIPTGLVSTLTSISPLFVIAILGVRHRKMPSLGVIAASLVAFIGVVMIVYK